MFYFGPNLLVQALVLDLDQAEQKKSFYKILLRVKRELTWKPKAHTFIYKRKYVQVRKVAFKLVLTLFSKAYKYCRDAITFTLCYTKNRHPHLWGQATFVTVKLELIAHLSLFSSNERNGYEVLSKYSLFGAYKYGL